MNYQIVIDYDSGAGKFGFVAPMDQPIVVLGMLAQATAAITNMQKPAEKPSNGIIPIHSPLGKLASGN